MFVNRKVPIYQIRLEYINWYAREWLFVLIFIYSFHHFELLKHVSDTRSRRSEWCRFWSDQSKMARFQPCNIINKRGTMGSKGHMGNLITSACGIICFCLLSLSLIIWGSDKGQIKVKLIHKHGNATADHFSGSWNDKHYSVLYLITYFIIFII